jgi:hypothetical protein
MVGVFIAEWLWVLTSNHFLLNAVVSIPTKASGFYK